MRNGVLLGLYGLGCAALSLGALAAAAAGRALPALILVGITLSTAIAGYVCLRRRFRRAA